MSDLSNTDLLERARTYFVGPESVFLDIQLRLAANLEALELADATLRGANMNRNVVERKVSAAIAKARGEQAETPIVCRCSEEARNNRVASRMGAVFTKARGGQ